MNEKRRPQGRNFPPRPVQAAPAEEAEGQLEGVATKNSPPIIRA